MGSKTGIEWTDSTWNPIYGCSRVSEGCRNCYAERLVGRFRENGPTVYDGLTRIEGGRAVWTGQVAMAHEDRLLMPLKWRPVRQYDADDGERYADRRRRIFVNSMSDLFHENVTDEMRDELHDECVAYMVLVGALAQVQAELLEVLKAERRNRGLSV